MKFEELINIIEREVAKVIKEPMTEPNYPEPKIKKTPYRTALSTEEEIDEALFIQDDIKRLEKEEKRKKIKL